MRKVPFVFGEYYHLYCRGVDKRKVFTDKKEYARFLAYLYLLNTSSAVRPTDFFRSHTALEAFDSKRNDPLVAIGAYCLMPNHFHLYVTPLIEGGVSKFMQRVQTAYTMYFNEKHARAGALFGSTFKAEHVSNDRHAKYLFSYIHLNPAKIIDPRWKERSASDWKKLANYVKEYPYSSYKEYASRRHILTSPEYFPTYLKSRKDVVAHVEEWLQLSSTA